MKNFYNFLFFAACFLLLIPQEAQANDFLQHQDHYQVMAINGRIHMKFPIFSRGGKNYYVESNSDKDRVTVVWYALESNPNNHIPIFTFSGENKSSDASGDDDKPFGYAYVKLYDNPGTVVVTNIYTGAENESVPNDGSSHSYEVTKKKEPENGNDNVVWLEIDWYPPSNLDTETFNIGTKIYINSVSALGFKYDYEWTLKTGATGINNIIDPQLFEPFFYATKDDHIAGYGYAAVPYSLFYEPIEYHTSFNSSTIRTTDRSENLYVATTDSVQTGFNATFKVYIDKANGVTRNQTTQCVTIPAYHHIYHLTATEETDSTGTFTGRNLIQWNVLNPQVMDLVDNDFFEVQRALNQDFSDAETITMERMERGENHGTYTVPDDSRISWNGNATIHEDTVKRNFSVEKNDYELLDANGNPLARLKLKLTANNLSMPGVPIYYRVRRASASVWGWQHDYAMSVHMDKHNFLAPLAETQAPYTLDPDFQKNNNVHFTIHLENKPISYTTPSIDDCTLSLEGIEEDLRDSVDLIFSVNTGSLHQPVYARVDDKDGSPVLDRWQITHSQSVKVPAESQLIISYQRNSYRTQEILLFSMDDNAELKIEEYPYQHGYEVQYEIRTMDFNLLPNHIGQEIADRLSVLESSIKQEMLVLLDSATRDPSWGRSMWDKTARLVLVRSSEENPSAISEFIIPQDSIHRLADGSWLATYTDIANKACTHYTYAVRIDQSSCDLHVMDSTQLLPMALTGPSLYFDEAAAITSFKASQGATESNLKRGVMLNWAPSSNAVDEYVLMRKPIGSTDAPDTIYTGLDVTYFDLSALPDRHYEYTIVARYECNGNYSENSAFTEGWRTPYGEISGTVCMPDNSGMAGVKVDLQGPDDTIIRSVITGADGTFLFDSLTYALSGTQYAVIPTHTYAAFRYNSTNAGSASIALSADQAVVSGVQFANSTTVRISGRALFQNSSIPVAGAMFTLNGDTLLRNGMPLKTGTDGNFELTVTQSQPYMLRIFKPGHMFEGDGILHVEQGKDSFALTQALDAVRFYDQTKVRLVGRVAGGINQRDLPAAFGLGKNNLGEDLQLVLQIEGDNTAWFVLDPSDLSRDTIMNTFPHVIYNTDPLAAEKERTTGSTSMLTERKRITIHPDPATGEFQVDLFPIKYKVIQATARGYATLFASGQGSETFDLTNAPLVSYDPKRGNDSVHYNAVYDRIYRSPIQLAITQYLFGMEQKGLGETEMDVSGFSATNQQKVKLYTQQQDSTISYLLGYPLFCNSRKYQFGISAFEDYYYNNTPSGKRDRVPQRGGRVTVHNGLHNTHNEMTFELDSLGQNKNIWLDVDNLDTEIGGIGALRTVSAMLEMEGTAVETNSFQAFVVGNKVNEKELTSTEADITILDVIRDPGGNGSSAWVESGTSYTYSYTTSYDLKAGLELYPSYGGTVSRDIGVFTGTGAGSYTGSTFSTGKIISFTVPLVAAYSWGFKYTYTFSTTDRVSTSTKKNKSGIGGNADVFLGTTTSILSGKAKSVAIINDSLFSARRRAVEAGTLLVLAEGTDSNGNGYHLVTGEKVVLGSTISNTFAYSQEYIYNTVIPKLVLERYNLLMTFPDSVAAQAAADAANDVVYWYIDSTTAVNLQDTLLTGSYKMIVPKNSTGTYPDRVGALENMIKSWISVLYYNEKEKVKARESGKHIGTYSVNYGNTYTHSDTYSSTYNFNAQPVGNVFANTTSKFTQTAATALGSALNNAGKVFESDLNIIQILNNNFKYWLKPKEKEANERAFKTITSESEWTLKYNPVLSFTPTARSSKDKTDKKSAGFTLSADDQGDITVSVYRASLDSVWKNATEKVRDKVDLDKNDDCLFGSYVFFTEAGATYCVHEKEETTRFYNEGTVLSNPTLMIAKPELSINRYELSNVPADQRAQFRIEIRNAGERQYGLAGSGTVFNLSLVGGSNPDGAKVYLAGSPLIQSVSYFLEPGQSISQIIEVERGLVDDYENLQLLLSVGDCPKTNTTLNFSVHFMPESSPVSIASPRQNWVLNTLSQHDSVGYYMPIDISGFNIHHKNFDHIEFQYKLSTQSDEMWVNQCSFYADDSLYNLATGNKAMIENGRITPFRFYGERDPMEQQYDLRAVSFCRYGSGFVTKSSPVISGTKDTRPPRVFGTPEPANSILGVEDHLLLRFNEPIAGNYLDEDNNFQLLGITNRTGITSGTALHFDMANTAVTKVKRDLTNKSFTLDVMIRPSDANRTEDMVLFMFGNNDAMRMFILTADNRLKVMSAVGSTLVMSTSKPIGTILDFTRVLFIYDKDMQQYRFYAGTTDLTDVLLGESDSDLPIGSAELRFGGNYKGDMLETRFWTKALTPEEIAATANHYLTGYEQELLAYYRMNEGKGETITDRAHGATLYLSGCSWNKQKGYSAHLSATDRIQLNGHLFGRSKAYDATHMFWFKTAVSSSERANLFAAGRTDDQHGVLIALENGRIVLCSDSLSWTGTSNYADNEWHHVVLSVNRTYNNAALFVDGELIQTIPATMITGIEGAMYLGGNFAGYIDEFAVFEQAMPKALVEAYDNIALMGDEMGLIAYLPFEEQFLNPNGILEQRFSINDRRQFTNPQTGEVINKIVPLVQGDVTALADNSNNAPTSSHGLLTKLNFDWSFNGDELMINILNHDREVNKQSIYVTVRDVEDLNGNPMASPVTWTAFVDHNTLKWQDNDLALHYTYGEDLQSGNYVDFKIINHSGKRHQYKIESLSDWLRVNEQYGSINPTDDKTIRFYYDTDMPVGEYLDIVYLTDEDGLSEPLEVTYSVVATPPYDNVDKGRYPQNMSVCGLVKIGNSYDNDENDIVYAIYRNECIGKANVTVNQISNTAELYLTVYGNEAMTDKTVNFQLWQSSTGKVFNLTPSSPIVFKHGNVYGCGSETPILFSTSGSQMQNIELNSGWTWVSTNLHLQQETALINKVMTVAEPWKEGDLIKDPDNRQFSTYSEVMDAFVGTLTGFDYRQIYMVYSSDNNLMRLSGEKLAEKDKLITLCGKGEWNPFPCLFDEATEINTAMSSYYDNASPGDILKAHNRFAVFSADRRWVGDLTAVHPGEGYLFRRLGSDTVTMRFFNSNHPSYAQQRVPKFNGKSATNMTMIARVEEFRSEGVKELRVYVGNDLAAVATPIDSLYFLTIQSDRVGELRFELNGETLIPVCGSIHYTADNHHGSLKAPIILMPNDDRPYKVIENDHVVIIRNNEKYDVTGKKLQ